MCLNHLFFWALIDLRGRDECLDINNAWSIKLLKYQFQIRSRNTQQGGLAAASMVNRPTCQVDRACRNQKKPQKIGAGWMMRIRDTMRFVKF